MRAAIVQFPHPGAEHNAKHKQPIFPWNTGKHHRKFMRVPASYMDASGSMVHAPVSFWGEWEAPSRVIRTWRPEAGLPTYLHEPYWETPQFGGFRQNTDPWVFGDYFRYSNCKQQSQNALLHLLPGSMVLFGSTRGGQFVLDTCFIAASSAPMLETQGDDEVFDVCTINSLRHGTSEFQVHRGATVTNPIGGMFSFTPCLAGGETARFRRPIIELAPYVNPRSQQSPSGASVLRPPAEIRRAWDSVVEQVREEGLDLGVHMATPPRVLRPRSDE